MFFILLLILPGIVKSTPVIGGKDVGKIAITGKNRIHAFNPGKYPFLVYLEISAKGSSNEIMENRELSLCGGTLITPNVVLTAAHCVEKSLKDIKITVSIGTVHQRLGLDFQKAKVIDYLIHEGFVDSILEITWDEYNQNDIALLWLDKEFILTDKVQTATLADREFPVDNKIGRIAGWGLTEAGFLPSLLQEGKLRVISNKACGIAHKPVPVISSMMCAISDNGKTIHSIGDSGGPLVVHGVVVGIISWGEGKNIKCKDGQTRNSCDPTFPGVFTRVSEFLHWIKHNVKLGPPKSRMPGISSKVKSRHSKKSSKPSFSDSENLTTDEKSPASTNCKSSKSLKSCTIL